LKVLVVQEENADLVMTSVTNVVNVDILQGIANIEGEEVLVVPVEEATVPVVVVLDLDPEVVAQERKDLDPEAAQEVQRKQEVVLDLEVQRNLESLEVKAVVRVQRRKTPGAGILNETDTRVIVTGEV